MNGKAKPAWSLTNVDVERMLAVFARTLAKAIVEELRREQTPVRALMPDAVRPPDHTRFPMGPVRE